MSKLPSEASNRLMNILYSKTAPKITSTTTRLTKTLYEHEPPIEEPYPELVNQPFEIDTQQLLEKYNPKSNILKFNCFNSFITKQDFLRVFPRNSLYRREFRVTYVPMDMVKSRNPQDLSFNNAYYLVFPSKLQACIYLHETTTKMLNGIHLKFKFADIDKDTLSNMSSIHINQEYTNLIEKIPQEQDNYQSLIKLISHEDRNKIVRIRNLPFNLQPWILQRLLWDYNFQSNKYIIKDLQNETNLSLIKFNHSHDAQRFVRNFHGKKWDKINKQDREIQFFEPLLCEIVD